LVKRAGYSIKRLHPNSRISWWASQRIARKSHFCFWDQNGQWKACGMTALYCWHSNRLPALFLSLWKSDQIRKISSLEKSHVQVVCEHPLCLGTDPPRLFARVADISRDLEHVRSLAPEGQSQWRKADRCHKYHWQIINEDYFTGLVPTLVLTRSRRPKPCWGRWNILTACATEKFVTLLCTPQGK
jgi:hypothetical protein